MGKLWPGNSFDIGLKNLKNILVASTPAKSLFYKLFQCFQRHFIKELNTVRLRRYWLGNKFALLDFQLSLKQQVLCISHNALFPLVRKHIKRLPPLKHILQSIVAHQSWKLPTSATTSLRCFSLFWGTALRLDCYGLVMVFSRPDPQCCIWYSWSLHYP